MFDSQEIAAGKLGTELDEYLTRVTPFGFSGALLVARGDEVVLNKGYGLAIRDEDVPNTADTIFSLGSITKQFTAAAILKLEIQGQLNTADPIGAYFDGVPADKSAITLHHLLTHTAGVINYTGEDYEMAQRDETVQKVLAAPLAFAPGERYQYSNAGYTLLAAVVELVSGQHYEQFLHDHLFRPAGMRFTGYRLPNWEQRVVAHWYTGDNDFGTPLDKPYPSWNLLGNGDMLSTTGDMYRWHLALRGNVILSPEVKRKLYTPFLNGYAYGWEVVETPHGTLIQHGGASMYGSSADLRRYIEAGVVIMLFCNQSYGETILTRVVRPSIEKLVFGDEVAFPPAVTFEKKANLHKFAGDYELPSGGRLRAFIENDALVLTPTGQDAINALIFSTQDDLSHLDELNAQAESIFIAAIAGDYEPLSAVLADYDRRWAAVRQLVRDAIQEHNTQRVIVHGTRPSMFMENAWDTAVELDGELENAFLVFIWRNGQNVGVARVGSMPVVAIPFQPLSETEFAGYHLGLARTVCIRFNLNAAGAVAGLTILDNNVTAGKVKL